MRIASPIGMGASLAVAACAATMPAAVYEPSNREVVLAHVRLDEGGCPEEGSTRQFIRVPRAEYDRDPFAAQARHARAMYGVREVDAAYFRPRAVHHVHALDERHVALWTCTHPDFFSVDRVAFGEATMPSYQKARVVAKNECLADLAGKRLGLVIARRTTADTDRASDIIKTHMKGVGVQPSYHFVDVGPAPATGRATVRVACSMGPQAWASLSSGPLADRLRQEKLIP